MESEELKYLVEEPHEQLDIEYKSWIDLNDKDARANIARHICALANFGGGYIVFGFNKDMNFSGPRPPTAGPYDHDTISGIVKRYLTPTFQVTIYDVTSNLTDATHPIVRVPSHYVSPICSVRSGPEIKGKPSGIVQGTHYTRAAGPESVGIRTPEQWAPIMRRCVIHERTALLAGLESLFRESSKSAPTNADQLRAWHDAAERRFLELVDYDRSSHEYKDAHYQLSYQINCSSDEIIDTTVLLDELRNIGHEVHDVVDSGWSMFWIFDTSNIRPYTNSDDSIHEPEFLECSLIRDTVVDHPDFWRISPRGKASITRCYREDRDGDETGYEHGTWFWPYLMARELAELFRHARALSERFHAPESISFRLQWRGLKDREIKDPLDEFMGWNGHFAMNDNYVMSLEIGIAELIEEWPKFVSNTLSRVTRLFDPKFQISTEQIVGWLKRFKRMQ